MAKPRIRHPATAYIGRNSRRGYEKGLGRWRAALVGRAGTQSGLWMTRTELWKCEIVAAATEPARWPRRPLRWWEPITIRPQRVLLGDLRPGPSRSAPPRPSAAGRGSPPCSASSAPWAAVSFAAASTSLAAAACSSLPFDRHEADVGGLPDADDERLAVRARAGSRPARSRSRPGRSRRRRRSPGPAPGRAPRPGRRWSFAHRRHQLRSLGHCLSLSTSTTHSGAQTRQQGRRRVGGALAAEEALEVRRLRPGAAEPGR